MNTFLSPAATALALVGALSATTASAMTLDFVTVGDVGNPNDGSTGFGGVGYSYAIGTYEVTLSQYTAFLNAVAAADTYGLYSPSMGTNLNIAGISQNGANGAYTYSVIGEGNRPVTYVSWFDAARFTNWLHNGQPTGAQTAATTEDGAYTLSGAVSGPRFTKNGLAQYWVPSENEWYKAAYYQPSGAGGDLDGYWQYPTGSNAVPNSRNGSVSDPNSGNFFRSVAPIVPGVNNGYAVTGSTSSPSGNALTTVGAYTQADSNYGTFDQGGNVAEWNDAILGDPVVGVRGGSWDDFEFQLKPGNRTIGFSTAEAPTIGFRVASVPEPSTALLLAASAFPLLLRRRRR